MENKKDIGKAVRERLDLLEKSPDAALWSKIEKDLQKKRKKRNFAWLFLASPFIITTLFLWNNYATDTNVENKNTQKQLEHSNNNTSSLEAGKDNSANQTISITNELDSIKKPKKTASKTTNSIKRTEPQTSLENQKKRNKTVRLITSNSEYDEYEVVEKYHIRVNHKAAHNNRALPKHTITQSKREQRSTHFLADSRKKQNSYKKKTKRTQNTKNKPSYSQTRNLTKAKNNVYDASKNQQNKEEQTGALNPKTDSLKNSVTIPELKKDSLLKNKTKNKLPSPKKKEEQITKKDSLKVEYYLAGYYGPTISGSLFGKSLVNPSLNNHNKKHPITSSYGIYFGAKQGKIGVRVGLTKIDLENKTQIANYPNGPISAYSNIELHSSITPASISSHLSTSSEATITQKVSYYNVPLEFTYTYFSKGKFDFDALAGINITVLDKNNIRISGNQAPELSIGRTENLAATNFAFSVGTGANYNLTPKLQANITPVFKYFHNMGNEYFKPYSVSLQTGITFKF